MAGVHSPLLGQTAYSTDFQQLHLNSTAPGWVGATFTTWNDPLHEDNIVYGVRQTRRRAVVDQPAPASTPSGAFATYAAQSFSAASRLIYRGRFLRTDPATQFGLTLLSAQPDADRYYLIATSPDGMRLASTGAGELAGIISSGFQPQPNRWCWFDIEAEEANGSVAVRARFWDDGSLEPQTFSIDAVDAGEHRLAQGHIGLWSGGGDFFVDDLSVLSGVTHPPAAISFVDAATNQPLDPSAIAYFSSPARINVIAPSTAEVTVDGQPYPSGSPIAGDGVHLVSARAGETSATLKIVIDTMPPEVAAASPAANACSSAMSLPIAGRALDLTLTSVQVTAGGEAINADVAGDGTFTASLPIANEGHLDVVISARDRLGHTASLHLPVVIDRTKPSIAISSSGRPFVTGAFNRPVSIFAKAIDADSNALVTLTVNEQPYTPGSPVSADGSYVLRAAARDCAGNAADEIVVPFTIDTVPPRVAAIAPAEGAVLGATATDIHGTVDSDDLQSVAIEGSAFNATIAGRDFIFSALHVSEGSNHLTLLLTDRAGNVARFPYSFEVKSSAPTVAIVENGSPIPANALYNRAVTPVIHVSDPTASLSATLNGAPFTTGTAVSSDGSYTLTATASDGAGHSAAATANFTIDRTPPAIKILSPADGARIAADHVDVQVTATGADRVAINGTPSDHATVPLEIGANLITAVATDRAGNASSDQISVTRDDGRAGIVLIAPADNIVTNRPVIAVAGQVLTPSAGTRVTLNGVEVPVDASGAFRKTDFPLSEGANTITASIAGSTSAAAAHVIADFTPPQLTVLANGAALQNGDRFPAAPALTLQASDDRGSATTTLIVDGVAGSSVPLNEGGHTVTAIARDAAGNEARIDRTFVVGNGGASACVVSALDPPDGSAVFADSVRLSGRASGATSVSINGVVAFVYDGSFTANLQLSQEGANTIAITCGDATTNLTLFRATGSPSITIDVPLRNTTTAADSIVVGGTVGADVISGDVNGVPFTPANGAYSVANIPLAVGANIITARARNGAGRLAIVTTYVVHPAAPRITITSPLSGAKIGGASIDVSGSYSNVDPATIAIAGSAVTSHIFSDTTGTFIAHGVALTNGPATITVTGRSAAGVAVATSVDVQGDTTAPAITIESPADNSVFASSRADIAVSGSITPVGGAIVQVNGQQVATGADNQFSISLALQNGFTPIVARVATPDGRTASDSVRVTRIAGPLQIRSTFPVADAQEVDRGVLLLALFSNPIDASTVAAACTLNDANGQAVGTTTYVDDDAIAFAPNVPLAAGGRYTLNISTNLKDIAGTALSQPLALLFTTATSAPAVAPELDQSDTAGCFGTAAITGKATIAGARVRLDLDGVTSTVATAADHTFRFDVAFSGSSGYHVARVREVGGDGTLSPEANISYRISCSGPQVLAASLDRASKRLTIQFSKPMNAASLVAAPGGTVVLGTFSGEVSLSGAGDTAVVTYASDLGSSPLTLTVSRSVRDNSDLPMPADYTRVFVVDATNRVSGKGYISGAVYDASTGRPLQGAVVLDAITDDRGRYTRPFDEGAYTIEATASGFTTAWRQVIVHAGAGTIPLDFRLTRRPPAVTTTGAALALADGGDTAVTRRVELNVASAALPPGRHVTLASLGAESLPAPLPLGWSPVAAAEIAVDDSGVAVPMSGSNLNFVLTGADVPQPLSVVQYDSAVDQWRVIAAVAAIGSANRVAVDILTSGDYALVYPDRAPGLQQPVAPRTGASLQGVADPCPSNPDVCRPASRSFVLDPSSVAPGGRTVATLTTDGAKPYPSGTAIQATIDEQLNLADGRIVVDPPFTTDLLLYRTPAGDAATAVFHLAPSAQASSATLRDGVDHIRITDYPGRIDRGTLIGAEGGRVAGEMVAIDIPTGATDAPIHATIATVSDFTALGSIAGFHIVGGFTLSLNRADASTDPVSLLKSARATLTVPSTTAQVILGEVLSNTPFGMVIRLVALTDPSTAIAPPNEAVFVTRTIDPPTLPIDGVVHEGTYLVLTADGPIAFAFGQVRVSSGGATLTEALVTSALGVTDVSRIGGIFAVPVPAKPAAPFALRARSLAAGEGAASTAAAAPDAGAILNIGDLILTPQPPHLVALSPSNGAVLDPSSPFIVQATFDAPIDPASVPGAVIVSNIQGSTDSSGPIVTFRASEPLQPAAQYSLTILPQLRGANGAPFGGTVIAEFSTRNIPAANTSIHPELVRITIPDANGASIVSGRAGALPAGAQAVAVRRSRAFVTQYQATVGSDGSFSFAAGGGVDAIAPSDAIDLQVIDAVSHATIAIIPLTPFTTADGNGFLAPPDADVHFTSTDGTLLTVPAGAFDAPTLIATAPSTQAAFTDVPSFSSQLQYATSVTLRFDGVARKRIDVQLPVPPNTDTTKPLFLGLLGQSARGPRVMIVDTLHVGGGRLTTAVAPSARKSAVRGASVLASDADVRSALLGVVTAGTYGAIGFNVPASWAIFDGISAAADVFWDSMPSLYASSLYVTEGGGRILVPVAANTPFEVVGVDAATGLEQFRRVYGAMPAGDPVTAVALPSPIDNQLGPYPVFTTPARIEMVDLPATEVTLTSIRNFEVRLENGSITVRPGSLPLPPNSHIEVLNTSTGNLQVADNFISGQTIVMPASVGDRILLFVSEKNVDASQGVSVVFNKPIFINGDADAFLHAGRLIRVLTRDPAASGDFADISQQVKFVADSGNRRITVQFDNPLQLGKEYRLVLSRDIGDTAGPGGAIDLRLAQRRRAGSPGPQLSDDLHIDFSTRSPGGRIGTFDLQRGVVRDLSLNGNIALVSALDGGLQAFDVSDPASLDTRNSPQPFASVPSGATQFWAVASDRHGRVYTTGLTDLFGVLRTYRLNDFLARQIGASTVCWRPGTSTDLDLATDALIENRPEATPRKLQIVLQDAGDDVQFSRDTLASAFNGTSSDLGNGFTQINLTVRGDRASPYQLQTITVENRTLDLRWSVDVARSGNAAINGVIARDGDALFVVRNQRTYGVVSLFGYGIGIIDLNAVESNDVSPAEPNYQALKEQVGTSTGSNPNAPSTPCDAVQSAATGAPCPIRDLAFSPEALIRSDAGLKVFALDAERGVLDLNVIPGQMVTPAGGGLTLASSLIDQPRLHTLRDLYRTASGRQPFGHFISIASYKKYALIAANQFGLLVVRVIDGALSWDSLADVVWIPAGAVSVRVVPENDLAVVVDGAGRVLLVDLKKIDQSSAVAALPECRSASCSAELFPIARKALQSSAAPLPSGADWTEVGADDPRIIWKSAEHLVRGTLAPVVDPSIGFLFTGDVNTTRMNVVAATDPKLRVLVNTGRDVGEAATIVPLGIAPPANVVSGVNGSLGAFRLTTSLPAGMTAPRFFVDAETVKGTTAPDPPAPLPPSHLRGSQALTMTPVLPATILTQYPKLRFQRGANQYVSPWIVAIADPRAAKRYSWPSGADKAAAGCFACDRPQSLENDDSVREMYLNGRFVSITTDPTAFAGNYAYLNDGRLTTRVSAFPADTVRPMNVLSAAQGPPFASGALQSSVLLHSGELVEQTTDLDAGGRAGWNVVFDRTYRSRTLGGTALGVGWESSIFRRLRELPNSDVEYRDGTGEEWLFRKSGASDYASPAGLYLRLTKTADGWRLIDQKQGITSFDVLGRLSSESDVFYNGAGTGNVIRYIYDFSGRLTTIIDPLSRASTLAYDANGLLKTMTDWRGRTIDYHFDSQDRLSSVDLPRTKNSEYLEYDHGSDSTRPKVTYGYGQSASDYNASLELATNLVSILDPGDTLPRINIDYYGGGSQRDMLQKETWGTTDRAAARFEYTIDSPLLTAAEAVVTDALNQRRTFRMGNFPPASYSDDRVHVRKIIEAGLPIWAEAPLGSLPNGVIPSSAAMTNVDRTTEFEREDDGRIRTITKSTTAGAVSVTSFTYAPAGTIGFVLSARNVSTPIEGMSGTTQNFAHDGAFLRSTESDGDRVDTPEARRNQLSVFQSDGGATTEHVFNADGLLKETHTLPPASPAAGAGEKSSREYFADDDSSLFRRAMPKTMTAGDDLQTTIEYPDADSEVQHAPRDVETRIDYDELRRPIHIRTTGPGSIQPEEWFAYDARGRLVRHRKRQGDKEPEERYEYDVAGRQTRSSLYDGTTEVESTRYEYSLPERTSRTILPAGGIITNSLDGLGRVLERMTDPLHPFATITLERTRYDADDNVVFTTDGREATATRYDAAHRAVETLRSDSNRTTTKIDGWGRLRESKDVSSGTAYRANYTPGGKLQNVSTNTSSQDYGWDAAGRTRSIVSRRGADAAITQSTYTYDSAARLLDQKSGASDGTSITQAFSHNSYGYNGKDVPETVTAEEDEGRSSSTWRLDHDALGRTTNVQNVRTPAFAYDTPRDEGGNVTSSKTPSRPGTFEYKHDARGLTTDEKLPDAASPNRYGFDPGGAIKQYTDPEGEETRVTNDGLGRPVLRTYPDQSTEEIHYNGDEVSDIRDRQGRWLHFEYNLQGQLEQIRNDNALLDHLDYDIAGRLIGWASEGTRIEWDDFDPDNRPQTTRQIRYRPDGAELDRFTQRHTWNGMGERVSWSMPPSASMGSAGWTTVVSQDYDAMGNVVAIRRGGAIGASVNLMTAEFRNAGRPKSRAVTIGAGPSQLVRKYEYDDAQSGIGRLTDIRVFSGASLIAGAHIDFAGLLRQSEELFGVAGDTRSTRWTYDDRGRLTGMLAAAANASSPANGVAGSVIPSLTDADFQTQMNRTASSVPSAQFTPKPGGGHKIGTIARADQTDSILYQKSDGTDGGSHRTEDSRFRYQFDERGRLRKVTERLAGQPRLTRVVYSYNAMDRLVGRRVETATIVSNQTPQESDWTLSADAGAIPASVTFVWDPISDQLIEMFEAEKYESGAIVRSGRPLRQFIHGGVGYDDPIEIFDGVHRYYPVRDEAGTGSLQAVVDESGKLVNRTLMADPYGEDAEALNGPAVDKITISGATDSTTVSVHLTEPVDPSTLTSARLTPSSTPVLSDAYTITWTLATVPPSGNLTINLDGVRSTTFGPTVPILFPGFSQSIATLTSLTRPFTLTPLNVTSLATLGTRDQTDLGASLVMSPFKAHPFTDPFTGLDYVRARWLDKRTGTFLSPDPAGYRDSANLYAYGASDAVNNSDPTGLALYAFDGTGNDKDNPNLAWTNIAKLWLVYTGSKVYEVGVGTGNVLDEVIGGMTGNGARSRVSDAYERLKEKWAAGDRTIDIVGFSRGAAEAVEFANRIWEEGIPDGDGTPFYPQIRFLGLFDMVGSIGAPGTNLNPGFNLTVPPNVQTARMMVSANEYRNTFPLSHIQNPQCHDSRVVEKIVRGAHSDVGGGYSVDPTLSRRALNWMYEEMKNASLPLKNLPPSERNVSGEGIVHRPYENWKFASDRVQVWADDLMHRNTERQEYFPPCKAETLE